MRAIIQRVRSAKVEVGGRVVSEIGPGILTLLGIFQGDDEEKLLKLITKILDLRIFEDDNGKMNLSLREKGGSHLIVSQFTLAGDCTTGRRPSFTRAERPDLAKGLYEKSLQVSSAQGVPTVGGVFQAHMEVTLVNDGPVTFLLEA